MKTFCTIVNILVSVKDCSVALGVSAHRSGKDERISCSIASCNEALVVRYGAFYSETTFSVRIPLIGAAYDRFSTWRYINKDYTYMVCHKGRLI